MNNQSQQSRKRERGQSAAEFVIVFPFLILLFFLMVDFGWLFKNWIVLTNASREATRCVVANSCPVPADPGDDPIEELILARLNQGLLSNLVGAPSINVEYVERNGTTGANPGDSVVVCIQVVSGYISPVIPFLDMVTGGHSGLPDAGVPLRTREEMLIEFNPGYSIAAGDGQCQNFT